MNPRVGLVAVSHSRPLADAALALAMEMVHGDPPRVEVAAGTADGGTGTDAAAVAEAIVAADDGAGVVVLMDLGSAVLSAEMALEFLPDPGQARLVAAPFVEGLLAAVVRAAGGATLDEVAAEAERALGPKREHLGDPVAPQASPAGDAPAGVPDESGTATVVNADGIHARPAAALATAAAGFAARIELSLAGRTADCRSPLDLAALAAGPGSDVRVSAWGDDAAAAVARIVAMVDEGFGEPLAEAGARATAQAEPAPEAPARGAVGVSPGRAVGAVIRLDRDVPEPAAHERVPAPEREAEAARVGAACAAVADDLRARAAAAGGQRAEVLNATALMAQDKAFAGAAATAVRERGLTAPRAAWEAGEAVAGAYAAAGGRLAERATDVRDVRDRVVARLVGIELPDLAGLTGARVVVAIDLAPADTVGLDAETCAAIVTAQGGPTSHTAIIARELGIPAVVGAADAMDLEDGVEVLVDGSTGEVLVAPDSAARLTVTPRVERVPLAAPGATADGTGVPLLANVAGPDDARESARWGAEGVGLFRTELCFLDRAQEPSVEEQRGLYREVLAAFPGRKVVIRTLDAGSDKPLPFLNLAHEPNPSLGVRGYRHARRHPQVLDRQLEAIAAAAADTGVEAWAMAPMIATPAEAADFVARARAAGVTRAGVMIETPAAAALALEVCAEVDFVSIGTNDLTQYTMAADRMLASLADLSDPWHPAVLRTIAQVGAAGAATGTPVGICGEAAGDPRLAPVLVGLGATSLSMSARLLSGVGGALGALTLDECRRLAAAAVATGSATAARQAATPTGHLARS